MVDLREAFSGRRGLILAAGGVVLVGYLWWTRGRHLGEEELTDAEGFIVGEPADRTRQPNAGPQSDPTVGNDVQGDARPQNAEEWISRSVSTLSNPPYNMSSVAVYSALRKAIDGLPLTTAEAAIIEAAIRAWGTPPGGMPPLNIGAPAGNPQAPTPSSPTVPAGPSGTKAPRRYMISGSGRRTWLDPAVPGWYSGKTQRLPYRSGFKAPRRYYIPSGGKRKWFDPRLPAWPGWGGYSGQTQRVGPDGYGR